MARAATILSCLALAAAIAVPAAAARIAGDPAPARVAGPTELLPDLDIVEPEGVAVMVVQTDQGRRFQLGFISALENYGAGPLRITGSRPDLATPTMTATQVVTRSDGTTVAYPVNGVLQYVVDPTHQHWHLLRVMTYELRRPRDFKLVRPDQKTGFCLGDRFAAPYEEGRKLPPLPNKPPGPVFEFDCEGKNPEALTVEEGLSVGYGDDYGRFRDGQQIDITGLKAGRYLLVHRANVERSLLESSYSNNVSLALISIEWPKGMSRPPKVKIIEQCTKTAHCKAR